MIAQRLLTLAILHTLWFLGSCGAKTTEVPLPKRATPSTVSRSSTGPSVKKPSDILAWANFPRGLSIPDVANAIDNIMPGSAVSAMLSGALAQEIDLSHIDTHAPISVFLTNPKSSDNPLLLVVKASDLNSLRQSLDSSKWKLTSRQGLALLSVADLGEDVVRWALRSHTQSALTTTLRLFPHDIVRIYGDDIDSLMSAIPEESSKYLSPYGLSLEESVAQIEFLELQFGSENEESDLYIRIQPIKSSTLAALSRAQKPSQFELLRHLPATSGWSMVLAGDFHAGAASKAILDFSLKMTSKLTLGIDYASNSKLLSELFEVLDGKFAMTMMMATSQSPPKVGMVYLMGTSDSEVVQNNWRTMMHMQAKAGTQETFGVKLKSEFIEKVAVKDGVDIDRNASQVPTAGIEVSMLGHFAAFDNIAVMSMSDDSLAKISHIIASVRGKQLSSHPSDDIAHSVKRSLSRQESAFIHVDLTSMLPQGQAQDFPVSQVTIAVGQDQGALVLRISGRK